MKKPNLRVLLLSIILIYSVNLVSAQTCNQGVSYLKLTNTGKKFENGLYQLKLQYFKDGKSKGFIIVNSGTPNSQIFRPAKTSKRGSYEPLPEGKWYVHDIRWANGKDVYQGSFGEGLGPVKIPLEFIPKKGTQRGSILIHLDSNAPYSPGTAGCIGVQSIADFKRLVSWLRETDPRDLYVDWGHGTIDY